MFGTFQAVIEHGSKLSTELATSYLNKCDCGARSQDSLIHLGLRLGKPVLLNPSEYILDNIFFFGCESKDSFRFRLSGRVRLLV